MSPAGESARLPRVLGPTEALCVIVGSVIGSGIFLVPATVAQEVPAIGGIALVWILGGLLSLAGALTLAELGAMMPQAGGPYVYLREAYGPLPAFLFGWTEFWVIRAGAMATLAAAFARYLNQVLPAPEGLSPVLWQTGAAVLAMATLAAINVLGTKLGGFVQVAGTVMKVGALLAMIGLPFLVGAAAVDRLDPVWPSAVGAGFFAGMMAAMVSVLWTYDGWINLTPLAEEIRDPQRNVPRALIGGVVILITLYLGVTLAYHLVLPLGEIASDAGAPDASRAVAADFFQRLLGPAGVVVISLIVMTSTFISLNGNALAGPRAYFAMSRDGLFPKALHQVHRRFRTPANAIIAQTVWAIVLTGVGTVMILTPPPSADSGWPRAIVAGWNKLHQTPLYNVLFTYVIFGSTIFYTLAIASVFVLRVKRPELPRPYRTWGYPWTPSLYLAGAFLLLGSMLWQTPFESVAGLVIIAIGLPVYAFLFRYRHSAVVPEEPPS